MNFAIVWISQIKYVYEFIKIKTHTRLKIIQILVSYLAFWLFRIKHFHKCQSWIQTRIHYVCKVGMHTQHSFHLSKKWKKTFSIPSIFQLRIKKKWQLKFVVLLQYYTYRFCGRTHKINSQQYLLLEKRGLTQEWNSSWHNVRRRWAERPTTLATFFTFSTNELSHNTHFIMKTLDSQSVSGM